MAVWFGTRKSQVQILPPRPPSIKIGGTEYYRYEFWVGSWVGGFGALVGAARKPRRTRARNSFRACLPSWSTHRQPPSQCWARVENYVPCVIFVNNTSRSSIGLLCRSPMLAAALA